MTRKIILITMACSMLIAYGLLQRRLAAHSSFLPKSFKASNVDMGVEPPAGVKFVRSYESTINGAKALFGHYVSALPALDVVDRFIAEHPGARRDALAPSIIRGGGCAAAGYADGSHVVGVVAFDAPNGSNFFMTRAPITALPTNRRPMADVPGADAPGVPRPLNSVRMLSVEDLGGIPSVLAFYEGWGGIGQNVDYFRDEMRSGGWKEHRLAERLMNEELEGEVLSFAKDTKRCFVYFEKDRRSGKLTTAVLYRVKDWLPPGSAY